MESGCRWRARRWRSWAGSSHHVRDGQVGERQAPSAESPRVVSHFAQVVEGDTFAVPPPTSDEIAAHARAYYNTRGPLANSDAMIDGPAAEIQSQDETQLTACIAFPFADVSSPDTVAGSDTRLFTLARTAMARGR